MPKKEEFINPFDAEGRCIKCGGERTKDTALTDHLAKCCPSCVKRAQKKRKVVAASHAKRAAAREAQRQRQGLT